MFLVNAYMSEINIISNEESILLNLACLFLQPKIIDESQGSIPVTGTPRVTTGKLHFPKRLIKQTKYLCHRIS